MYFHGDEGQKISGKEILIWLVLALAAGCVLAFLFFKCPFGEM